MGTDIHWIMERRLEDGGWEAVATEEYNSLRDLPRHHYLVEIGKRNYELFRHSLCNPLRDPRPGRETCHARIAKGRLALRAGLLLTTLGPRAAP